jgi:hypothetical protein
MPQVAARRRLLPTCYNLLYLLHTPHPNSVTGYNFTLLVVLKLNPPRGRIRRRIGYHLQLMEIKYERRKR